MVLGKTMKNAICLSGQPRIINEIYYNNKQILSSADADLHIHGWWSNDHKGKTKLFHSTEKFSHEDMSEVYINLYKPSTYHFEEYKDFDLTFCKGHDYSAWENCSQKHYDIFTPSLLYGQLSQSQSVKESVYLAIRKKDYRLIVRSRPDVVYTKDLNLIISLLEPKEDVIYFQSSMSGGHRYGGEFPNNPCDWFFTGSPNAMKKFVDSWHTVIKNYYSTGVKHTRDTMRRIADYASIKIELVDFGVIVYRQLIQNTSHRDVNLYYEEFNSETLSIIKNHEEWPHWHTKIDFYFLKGKNE